MTSSDEMDRFVNRIRLIDWMSAPRFTDEGDALLAEHARRMRAVAHHFRATRGWSAYETDVYASPVGMQSAEGAYLLPKLFEVVRGIVVREHLIINAHAYFFWHTDDELRHLENPFEPLMLLYEAGFTTAGGVSESEERLEMTLGCQEGIREYTFDLSQRGNP